MKICPKCHFEISEQDKFCINCGYSFQASFNRKMISICVIIILLLFGLAGLIYRSFKLEQEYMKPYAAEYECDDAICKVTANYDRENKVINANIEINEIIEHWQKVVVPAKSKAQLVIFLPVDENTPKNSDADTINYESEQIVLNVGSPLSIEYKISNVKLKDFVKFKKHLQSGFVLDLPMAIDTISENRKFAKNEYLAKKERERQQAAQAARLHSQLYNMMFNPYSYYGGYYY